MSFLMVFLKFDLGPISSRDIVSLGEKSRFSKNKNTKP